MKRCRYSQCREKFEPRFRTTEVCCSDEHAVRYARESSPERIERARKRVEAAKKQEQRAAKRKWREETATIPQLKAKADKEFGKFIRERDFYMPCISCDETNPPMTSGGQWDCGHFRSKGAADHLRYDERNSAKQCKSCNGGSGNFEAKRATVHAEYRKRLIVRIGLNEVEALETDNRTVKWNRDMLIALRRGYLAAWKELKARREARAAA